MRRSAHLAMAALALAAAAPMGGQATYTVSARPKAPDIPKAALGGGGRGRRRSGSTSNLLTKAQKKRRNKLAKLSRGRNRR